MVYTNWNEILAFIIENALLCSVMSHTRSDKSSIPFHNPVIVFF